MEHALALINLASDIVAMTAAVINLIDTVLRHQITRGSNQ